MEIITLTILAILGIGAVLRSSWALVLILLMFTLEQSLQASVSAFRAQPALANYVIGSLVVASAARAVFVTPFIFRGYFSRCWWFTIVIFAWGAFSLLWTPSAEFATEMTRSGLPYFVLCIVIAPLLIDGIDDFHSLGGLLLFWGTIIAITIVVNPEFNIRSGRLGFALTERVRSNPLALGELGGTLMIVASLYKGRRTNLATSVLRAAAFIVGTILALYSGSRGQVLFAGSVALGFVAVARPVRSLASFATTVLLVLFLAASLLLLAQLFLDSNLAYRWDTSVLAEGAEVRRLNILDLLIAFLRTPLAWVIGLGWNAFSSITDASTEPYSHSLLIDVLCELGIPMLMIYAALLMEVYRSSRSLVLAVRDKPIERAGVASFVALAAYQFLLSNKQGHLWGVCPMFLIFILICRVRIRHDAFAPLPQMPPSAAI